MPSSTNLNIHQSGVILGYKDIPNKYSTTILTQGMVLAACVGIQA